MQFNKQALPFYLYVTAYYVQAEQELEKVPQLTGCQADELCVFFQYSHSPGLKVPKSPYITPPTVASWSRVSEQLWHDIWICKWLFDFGA